MLWNELTYTLKILIKNSLFTLLCSSVLAVGLGIMLPFYVLVANLELKTPDFPDGKRFVALYKEKLRGSNTLAPYDAFHYRYFQQNTTSFAELYAWKNLSFTVSDGEKNYAFSSAAVEPKLLQVPQTQPLRGRLFTDGDAQPDASLVAIISYELWQSYYAAREDIIGLGSHINGAARTIVGVMPPRFRFPLTQDIWIPLSVATTASAAEGATDLQIAGKLKIGATLAQASNEIGLLQASILLSWPEQYRLIDSSRVVPYVQIVNVIGGTMVPTLAIAFLSLLLLVVFNLGNLLLARGEERVSELAIRSALGASSMQLAASLLLESLIVCCCGFAVGCVLAHCLLAWVDINFGAMTLGNSSFARAFWWDLGLNSTMLSASALITLAVWLVCGGLPAWRIARSNLSEALASSSKGSGKHGVTRLSKTLVNTQLVICCILLTVGITQTLSYFNATPTTTKGAEQLYLSTLDFSGTSLLSQSQRQQHLADVERSLVTQPGVQQVAFTSAAPGTIGPGGFYTLEDQDLKRNGGYPAAYVQSVSANYFEALGVNLLAGRSFDASDTADSLPVIIIDQRLADRYWPNASALGKRLQINPQAGAPWYTVIGVNQPINQDRRLSIGNKGTPVIYRATVQTITDIMRVMVHMKASSPSPVALFSNASTQVGSQVPMTEVSTLRQVEINFDEEQQFIRNLFAVLIWIALYVSSVASYGLAARVVGRRRIETGIRMALGAGRSACAKVFLKDGFKTVLTGWSLGAVSSILMGYITLGNVNSINAFTLLLPTTFIITTGLAVIVMLANYVPARKLIDMEPAEALRYE